MQELEELEPAGVPPAMLDIFILLLGIFMCLAGILITGADGMREVRLALPAMWSKWDDSFSPTGINLRRLRFCRELY